MLATIALWILAATLVAIGIVGLALPALPGAPLLFLGLVVAAWAENFQYLSAKAIAVLAALAVATYIVDIAAGALGARRFGASKRAMVGAMLGALVGIFFGLLGIVLGPFLGALAAELTVEGNLKASSKSGLGATLGMLIGALAKLAIAFSMVGLFTYLRFN
jgi:uncharacterized protein YqgC (DUF456 family)